MRAGDTVLHRPSGETWIVASLTTDGALYACGWPESRADAADVEVTEPCSDEEHEKMLRDVGATTSDHGGHSARASWARENLRAEQFKKAVENAAAAESITLPRSGVTLKLCQGTLVLVAPAPSDVHFLPRHGGNCPVAWCRNDAGHAFDTDAGALAWLDDQVVKLQEALRPTFGGTAQS